MRPTAQTMTYWIAMATRGRATWVHQLGIEIFAKPIYRLNRNSLSGVCRHRKSTFSRTYARSRITAACESNWQYEPRYNLQQIYEVTIATFCVEIPAPPGATCGRWERNHPAESQVCGIRNSDQPQLRQTHTSGEGVMGG